MTNQGTFLLHQFCGNAMEPILHVTTYPIGPRRGDLAVPCVRNVTYDHLQPEYVYTETVFAFVYIANTAFCICRNIGEI